MQALIVFAFLFSSLSFAGENDFSRKNRTEFSPNDYLFRQQPLKKDPVFDEYRTVDLGVNLGIGSDCGRVDFKSTLQGALKNILDSRYFGDMGKDIIAGSPMLLTCYFSPTWCAILKHSQINANFMSQMRLNQCALMDKYTDSRVEDFYEERQRCIHREIEKNGGNIESAMQSCSSSRVWDSNLSNWAGSKYGEKSDSNKLIESSARWAGMDNEDGAGAIKLVQSLVGDTVLSKGRVSVEYGGKPFALTPRSHLTAIEKEVREKLCVSLLKKIDSAGPRDRLSVIQGADLAAIAGSGETILDRQTVWNLSVMPYKTRALYCGRLASSIALARFSDDMNRSLDVLTLASQNPNLPERRKREIEEKRAALKYSIDDTLALQEEKNSPLNTVVAQINQEGTVIHGELSADRLREEAGIIQSESSKSQLFDCADGVLCD